MHTLEVVDTGVGVDTGVNRGVGVFVLVLLLFAEKKDRVSFVERGVIRAASFLVKRENRLFEL